MELSRKKRWIVFFIFLCLVFVINMDQGIVSGTTSSIKHDLSLTEEQLGMFGSILFIGSTLGCIVSFTVINKFNRKKMLLLSIVINAVSLFGLTMIANYYVLLICRIITGLALSYLGIYIPVWCNQFGIRKQRSLMLALTHIASPLGYILGYVLGIFFDWRITFWIQVMLLMLHVPVFLWFIDDLYFSMTLMPKVKQSDKEQRLNPNNSNINESIGEKKDISVSSDDEDDSDSLFEETPIELLQETTSSTNSNDNSNDSLSKSIWLEIKICLQSKVFIMTNLALASIFIIISGIQFWSNDYMQIAVHITDDYTRLIIFGITALTSPICGILLGGIITSKIGGYESRHAILLPLIGACSVSLIANFVTLTNNIIFFSICFWLYLFFGSLCLPGLTGIIITSVPLQYAGNANALSTLFYNVAGKFPAPYLYAVLKNYTNIFGVKFPMICLLNFALVSVVCLIFASKFRYGIISKSKELSNRDLVNSDNECNINDNDRKNSITTIDEKSMGLYSTDYSSHSSPEMIDEIKESTIYKDIQLHDPSVTI